MIINNESLIIYKNDKVIETRPLLTRWLLQSVFYGYEDTGVERMIELIEEKEHQEVIYRRSNEPYLLNAKKRNDSPLNYANKSLILALKSAGHDVKFKREYLSVI